MNNRMKHASWAPIVIAALFLVSCMGGSGLSTRSAQESEITGTYDAVLYGCVFRNDIKTVAFLDKTGDQYTIVPYSSGSYYRRQSGLSAAGAVGIAAGFVDCSTSVSTTQTRSIIGPAGEVLGYEIRPLYQLGMGTSDALVTNYWIDGSTVYVQISLNPSVEKMISEGSIRMRSH